MYIIIYFTADVADRPPLQMTSDNSQNMCICEISMSACLNQAKITRLLKFISTTSRVKYAAGEEIWESTAYLFFLFAIKSHIPCKQTLLLMNIFHNNLIIWCNTQLLISHKLPLHSNNHISYPITQFFLIYCGTNLVCKFKIVSCVRVASLLLHTTTLSDVRN